MRLPLGEGAAGLYGVNYEEVVAELEIDDQASNHFGEEGDQ